MASMTTQSDVAVSRNVLLRRPGVGGPSVPGLCGSTIHRTFPEFRAFNVSQIADHLQDIVVLVKCAGHSSAAAKPGLMPVLTRVFITRIAVK